jgi:hypothetical protein
MAAKVRHVWQYSGKITTDRQYHGVIQTTLRQYGDKSALVRHRYASHAYIPPGMSQQLKKHFG